MVRISIPNLPVRPPAPPNALTRLPLQEQAAYVRDFLHSPAPESDGGEGTLVITGAGVSVDSGIRAYRGKEGSYSNPNYQPIFFGQLVEDTERGRMFRRRYWARSFLGYPPVKAARENPNHIYIAAMQALENVHLITQNVDNLHPKALSRVLGAVQAARGGPSTPPSPLSLTFAGRLDPHTPTLPTDDPHAPILELHGTLARVHCMSAHRHEQTRDDWQEQLAALNPDWAELSRWMEETGNKPRTNPDGDVELEGADYTTFDVPPCGECEAMREQGSIVKPEVIFFGESIPEAQRQESFNLVRHASRVLVLGTSLATYSAFRLVKAAREAGKRVLMITHGPTRADDVAGVEKMDREAGPVLRAYLDEYIAGRPDVEAVRSVLDSGVVKTLPKDGADAGRAVR